MKITLTIILAIIFVIGVAALSMFLLANFFMWVGAPQWVAWVVAISLVSISAKIR